MFVVFLDRRHGVRFQLSEARQQQGSKCYMASNHGDLIKGACSR